MFDYLNDFTRDFVLKLKAKELYELSLGQSPQDYHLLIPLQNNDLFWSDLCYFHYKSRPYQIIEAKPYFQGEYLFKRKEYQQAASLSNFRALEYLMDENLKKKNYAEAQTFAMQAETHFGIVGTTLCLKVYLQICQNPEIEAEVKRIYAEKALTHLAPFTTLTFDKRSEFYLKNFQWNQTVIEGYIRDGSLFFSSILAQETTPMHQSPRQ